MKRIPRKIWLARFAWVIAGLIYGTAAIDAPLSAKFIMAVILGAAMAFVPTQTE